MKDENAIMQKMVIESSGNMEERETGQRIKLSVIVPVYNAEIYLRRCLDSILAQTYRNLEIILVDDGSTDRSGEICDEYVVRDNRIHVIHKKNGGMISARKVGILCAEGEYTTTVDSDDWIEKNAYTEMVRKLNKYHPEMLVFGYKKEYAGFTEEYRQGLREGFYREKEFWEEFNRCVRETPFFNQPIDMILWNKVIKTDQWKKYQMICPDVLKKNADDDAVIFPCLLNINSIYVGSQCFYHYCVRKNSVLWKEERADYNSLVEMAKYFIVSYQESKNKEKMAKNFLLYKLFYHLLLDIPEKMISKEQCTFYPRIKPGDNIVIYGKGVFASKFMERIRTLQYCNIVDNVDKTDVDRLRKIEESEFDFIVVAILNHSIAASSAALIADAGVVKDKILCIEKEDLVADLLPAEIRNMWIG